MPPYRFTHVFDAPVHMLPGERVALYSVVFAARPARCVEVGTLHGGSAVITVAALDDIGEDGRLVCIDPEPQVLPETWASIEHRAQLITGYSPDAFPEAQRLAGGPFDFAMIDGDHSLAGMIRDLEGVLPYLADQAYVLMHDAHYYEVRDGIQQVCARFPGQLIDCGLLSTEGQPDVNGATDPSGAPIVWGGMHLLRYRQA